MEDWCNCMLSFIWHVIMKVKLLLWWLHLSVHYELALARNSLAIEAWPLFFKCLTSYMGSFIDNMKINRIIDNRFHAHQWKLHFLDPWRLHLCLALKWLNVQDFSQLWKDNHSWTNPHIFLFHFHDLYVLPSSSWCN